MSCVAVTAIVSSVGAQRGASAAGAVAEQGQKWFLAMLNSKLEDAKQQLLANAAEVAFSRKGAAAERDKPREFLANYYRHAAPEDVLERSAVDIYGAAMSHAKLAHNRPQGTANVRVFTPSVITNEWAAAGHSVIEIVTDDMPFLVDSVTMALTTDHRSIHVVIHPQMVVRRDVSGRS